MNELIKQAQKNRLTKSLKTKLGMPISALWLPANLAAGEHGFKGKETADWARNNPGKFTKNLAVDTAVGAIPVGRAAQFGKRVLPPVISSVKRAVTSKPARVGAIAATTSSGSLPSATTKRTQTVQAPEKIPYFVPKSSGGSKY